MWNDPDQLRSLSSLLQWSAVALVFLGGVLQVARFTVDKREKTVTTSLQALKEAGVQQKISGLEVNLGDRTKEISGLEVHLGERQKEITELKLKAKELEERQAPWHLTNEQKQLFIARLKGAPKGRVAIEYIRADEVRSHAFAVELRDLLKDAGFEVWGYMAGFMQADAPPLIGLQISVKDEKSKVVGGGLQRAFKAIGIEAEGARRSNQTYEDDFVVIYVGIKP